MGAKQTEHLPSSPEDSAAISLDCASDASESDFGASELPANPAERFTECPTTNAVSFQPTGSVWNAVCCSPRTDVVLHEIPRPSVADLAFEEVPASMPASSRQQELRVDSSAANEEKLFPEVGIEHSRR